MIIYLKKISRHIRRDRNILRCRVFHRNGADTCCLNIFKNRGQSSLQLGRVRRAEIVAGRCANSSSQARHPGNVSICTDSIEVCNSYFICQSRSVIYGMIVATAHSCGITFLSASPHSIGIVVITVIVVVMIRIITFSIPECRVTVGNENDEGLISVIETDSVCLLHRSFPVGSYSSRNRDSIYSRSKGTLTCCRSLKRGSLISKRDQCHLNCIVWVIALPVKRKQSVCQIVDSAFCCRQSCTTTSDTIVHTR